MKRSVLLGSGLVPAGGRRAHPRKLHCDPRSENVERLRIEERRSVVVIRMPVDAEEEDVAEPVESLVAVHRLEVFGLLPAIAVVRRPVEVDQVQEADNKGRDEECEESDRSEQEVPNENEKDVRAVTHIGPAALVSSVLRRIAVEVEELRLQLLLDVRNGGNQILPVARLTGVRVLLDAIGEGVVTLMDDLPRSITSEHDEAAELADQAIDGSREVPMGAVVDEHTAENLNVTRGRDEQEMPRLPRRKETREVRRGHGCESQRTSGEPETVVDEVKARILAKANRGLRSEGFPGGSGHEGRVIPRNASSTTT